MPYYRLTTHFTSPWGGGSEQLDFFSSQSNLAIVRDGLVPLYTDRCQMLADRWSGVMFTVAQIADDAQLPVQRAVLPYKQGLVPLVSNGDAVQVDVSANLVMYGLNYLRSRRSKLIGIPESIEDGNFVVQDPGFAAKFGSWEAKLMAMELGWFSAEYQPAVNVLGYTITDVGDVTVQVATAVAEPPAQTAKFAVRISGVNTKSELNGFRVATNWRAATPPLAGFQFDVIGKFGLIPYQAGGTVRIYSGEWVAAGDTAPLGPQTTATTNTIVIDSIGKRQRGAPFGSGRGRAAARVRT